jgi:hypothetical protein
MRPAAIERLSNTWHNDLEKGLLRLEELPQKPLAQRCPALVTGQICDLAAIGGNRLALAEQKVLGPHDADTQLQQMLDAPYAGVPEPDRVFIEHRMTIPARLCELTRDLGQYPMIGMGVYDRWNENLIGINSLKYVSQAVAQKPTMLGQATILKSQKDNVLGRKSQNGTGPSGFLFSNLDQLIDQ